MDYLPRIIAGFFLAGYMASSGYKKKSLSLDGAICAFFVGFIHCLVGFTPLVCLLLFFITSSKLTKFNQEKKRKLEDEFKEGGQRDCFQVIANAGVPTLLCILYLVWFGSEEFAIDFNNYYFQSLLINSIIIHYSGANGDTWASELGILSKRQPLLITSFTQVPSGTNGGVSIQGTIASALSGWVIAFGVVAVNVFLMLTKGYPRRPIGLDEGIFMHISTYIICVLSSLFASILDSILGATLQYSGWDSSLKRVVNKPTPDSSHISGVDILSNGQVNFVSLVIAIIILTPLSPYITEAFVDNEVHMNAFYSIAGFCIFSLLFFYTWINLKKSHID